MLLQIDQKLDRYDQIDGWRRLMRILSPNNDPCLYLGND